MNRLDEEKILLTRLPEQVPAGANPTTVKLTDRGRLELQKRELEAKIQQLREHYSDLYPDMAKATHRLEEINAQINSLPPDPLNRNLVHSSDTATEASATSVRLELIDKEMKQLKAEQNHIQSQILAYQAKVDATPLREEQLVELNRNYETSKQHYQALLDKSFSANVAADLEQNQKAERFRVLDPAQVPEKPVKPNRKRLIPASGLFAFGFSIFCVIAKDLLNPAIKTEVELKSLVPAGVRVMGLIPRIEITADARRERRIAVSASFVCILLCLALVRVIWEIHPVL
jgi:uncharacterized protein involved in exopolysaccharide biosynthesis